LHASGFRAFLEEPGLVDDKHAVTLAQVFHGVGPHVVPDSVSVPGSGVEQALHPVWSAVPGGFGQCPAVLPSQGRQEATNIGTSPTSGLDTAETASDPREQVIQAGDPGGQVVIGHHKIDKLHDHDHEVRLEY
jgi:hypothetical protein